MGDPKQASEHLKAADQVEAALQALASETEATECYRAALQKIADDYPRATNEGAQKWARDALKNTAAPRAGEAHPPCTGATGPAAAAVPSASSETEFGFLFLGGTYETQGGERVKMVEIANIGTTYETLVDEAGAHRYSRRVHDMGRCTGTAHDYSDPRNIKRPIRALALDGPHRKSPPSATEATRHGMSEPGYLEWLADKLPALGDYAKEAAQVLRRIAAEKRTPSERGCTCHPDDNPPVPCQKKYALSECRASAQSVNAAMKYLQAAADAFSDSDAGLNAQTWHEIRQRIYAAAQSPERAPEWVEVLSELADLMDDVRTGDYKPDGFTTQPARRLLATLVQPQAEEKKA